MNPQLFWTVKRPRTPPLKFREKPRRFYNPGPGLSAPGIIAKQPNTNYKAKLYLYEQRKKSEDFFATKELLEKLRDEKVKLKFYNANEKADFNKIVNDRLNEKLNEYEDKIDARRERLKILFGCEEHIYIKEIVDQAQKDIGFQFQERLNKIKLFKEKEEEERLQYVKKMKEVQFVENCDLIRPVIDKQRLLETKQIQIIQMEENKNRKESEKELNKMWHDMKLKNMETLEFRIKQDENKRRLNTLETFNVQRLQVDQHNALRNIQKQEKLEEKIKYEKLQEELKQEELKAKEKKLQTKIETDEYFKKIIKERAEILRKNREEEFKLNEKYNRLVELEKEKEEIEARKKAEIVKTEIKMFKKFKEEMDAQKREEERRAEEVIEFEGRLIQQAYNDYLCKEYKIRQALLKNCVVAQVRQIEAKRLQAEKEKKMKELEYEFENQVLKQHKQLREEYLQQKHLKELKYADDLKNQIEFKNILKQREKDIDIRYFEADKKEEKLCNKLVEKVSIGEITVTKIHPFRKIINRELYSCPKTIY